MPKALLNKLPDKAKDIYEAAYEQALEDGRDEESAAKIAIAAVKRAGYAKDEDTGMWHKMHVVPMYITKATMGGDGVMRWSATVSKFGEDDQGDELTPEFYKAAIEQVQAGKRPDPVLCVSHIDKGKPDDSWVSGDVTDLYVDGDVPKAKGTFRDTPLGKAAFEAVREDYGKPDDEKVRISLGFYYDKAELLKTKSGAVKGRRFLSGWIKHLALTRVPVVKETNIELLEEKSMKTKREDAASIVGAELAEELVREDKADLDDGLILKAEDQDPEEEDEVEETPEGEEEEEMEDEGTETKAYDSERENQARDVLRQLADLLGVEFTVDTEVANSAALGNQGTNPPRAEEAAKSEAEELAPDDNVETDVSTPAGESRLKSKSAPSPREVEVASYVDSWAMQVKASLLSDGDRKEKFAALQQLINSFGEGVQALVKEQTPPSSRDIADVVSEAVRAAVEPVQNQLAGVKAELDDLRQKAVVLGQEAPQSPRPQSLDTKARVIQPQLGAQAAGPQIQQPNLGAPVKKARTAKELAWLSTQEGPGY